MTVGIQKARLLLTSSSTYAHTSARYQHLLSSLHIMPSFFDDDSDEDEFPAQPSSRRQQHQQARQSQAGPGPSSSAYLSHNTTSTSNRYTSDSFDNDDIYNSPPPAPPAGRREDVSMSSSFDVTRHDQSEDDPMGGGAGGGDGGDDDEGEVYSDVGMLMKAWVAERSCPSFLRYEEKLVEDIIYRVSQQVSLISVHNSNSAQGRSADTLHRFLLHRLTPTTVDCRKRWSLFS